MFHISTGDDGLVRVAVHGRLTGADYESFVPEFERMMARMRGRVPMLIELAPDFAGWNCDALWRDLEFGLAHRRDFERVAVVGDKAWEEWAIKLFAPFFRADIRYFGRSDREAARAWASAGKPH
ncbi:MAG: STAS/SEC14 domain-containing protein [Alphaproteobacteria bacterium]|nr:STAS/SEC14 domain-containing protein [Alphaproteobacteria bacterium]